MPKDKFIWNARKTGSFRASRVRNFTIDEDQGAFVITAWLSDDEAIKIGMEETSEKAQAYLAGVHEQIEGLNG